MNILSFFKAKPTKPLRATRAPLLMQVSVNEFMLRIDQTDGTVRLIRFSNTARASMKAIQWLVRLWQRGDIYKADAVIAQDLIANFVMAFVE